MRILLMSFMVPKILLRSTRTSWARPFSPMTTMLDFLPSAGHKPCPFAIKGQTCLHQTVEDMHSICGCLLDTHKCAIVLQAGVPFRNMRVHVFAPSPGSWSCKVRINQAMCSDTNKMVLPPSVALTTPLVYFVTVLLIPPHSPLSDVYATVTLFSTSAPAVCHTLNHQ